MTVIDIPLDNIEPDPNQPRKYFDETKLNELAVTITEKGVQSPILVRPHPAKEAGHYLLVFGERRWRASRIAGKDAIPSIVEDIPETDVLERQLIENSQRTDISALEEGEAYSALQKHHGHTIESLMSKTGKSRSHVYSRIKLTTLAPGVKKALAERRLQPAIADLAATIGDPKLQEQFCNEVLGVGRDDELGALGISYEVVEESMRQPLSWRAAKELLRRRYSLKLLFAKFDTVDPELTPAGACTTCPHRSGNQPELPGMGGAKADDLCTKPSCFEAKTLAAWKRAAAAAEERGLEVIEGKHVVDVFEADGVKVADHSPYVELDQVLPANLARAGARTTYGKLLGKRAADVPRVLVQDDTGAPRELLDRDKAVAVLRELGKIDTPSKPAKDKDKPVSTKLRNARANGHDSHEDMEKALDQRRVLLRRLEQDVIIEASKGISQKKEMAWWRWIIAIVCGSHLNKDSPLVTGLDKHKPWDAQLIEKATNTTKARAIVTGVLMNGVVDSVWWSRGDTNEDEQLFSILKILGIDPEKVALEITGAEKPAKPAKADRKKKAPAKKGGKKS